MKITLLTQASKEYWQILELSAPNKLQYCLRHGIQFNIRKHVESIKSTWSVINEREYFMRDALKTCDWLWFMGADTLIMDQKIDVRKFLDEDYDVIIGKDVYMINNDSFFIKNSAGGNYFIEKTLEYNKTEQTDQHSMEKVIATSPDLKVKIVHNREFNSYFDGVHDNPEDRSVSYQPGDFVLHFTGMGNERRIKLMKEYLNKVDK